MARAPSNTSRRKPAPAPAAPVDAASAIESGTMTPNQARGDLGLPPVAAPEPVQLSTAETHPLPASDAVSDPVPAQDGELAEAAPSPEPVSVEEQLAELGLGVGDDGLVEVEVLTGLSGPDFSLSPRQRHRCSPREAVSLALAGFAAQPGA